MTERLGTTTVGDIVAADFRTASVFEQFGIDFCCGGRRTLAEACRMGGVDLGALVGALDALPPPDGREDDVTRWPPERLIGYILSTHHAYVRSALPAIAGELATLVDAQLTRHPELSRVAVYFDQMRGDLEQHLVKEEQVLFPYVRDLATRDPTTTRADSPFGTVENPIRMMEREHRDATDALRTIRELTHGFTAPPDGSAAYVACMADLARFERDLHRHVHLENNVLFPKAVELEAGLGQV
jgi:regulator of cell morphogenesis and NO signaling